MLRHSPCLWFRSLIIVYVITVILLSYFMCYHEYILGRKDPIFSDWSPIFFEKTVLLFKFVTCQFHNLIVSQATSQIQCLTSTSLEHTAAKRFVVYDTIRCVFIHILQSTCTIFFWHFIWNEDMKQEKTPKRHRVDGKTWTKKPIKNNN